MNYTLAFTDPLAARSELSGGKGANLALLTQRAFPVPPGFVVTAKAYRDFVAGAAGLLRGVHRFPFGDAGRLRDESSRLRAALDRLALPAALVDEVRARLAAFPPGKETQRNLRCQTL
jgi:phosphoenolpyruvate synthase/pyruvate phosphate dikinase